MKPKHRYDKIFKSVDLFDSLDKEKIQDLDRKIEVEPNTELKKIVEGFEIALKRETFYVDSSSIYENLRSITPIVSSKEIQEFSVLLNSYRGGHSFDPIAGLYLSSLINQSKDRNFKICAQEHEKPLTKIGFLNSGKSVDVEGNIREICNVQSGNIYVNGNCDTLENIYGGNILVKGNCKSVGTFSNGGIIEILGNVKNAGRFLNQSAKIIIHGDVEEVGCNLFNGEIHVGGNAQDVGCQSLGGKIYLHYSYDYIHPFDCRAEVYNKVKGKWRRLK